MMSEEEEEGEQGEAQEKWDFYEANRRGLNEELTQLKGQSSFGNLILNWPKLLWPLNFFFFICVLEQFKHAKSK